HLDEDEFRLAVELVRGLFGRSLLASGEPGPLCDLLEFGEVVLVAFERPAEILGGANLRRRAAAASVARDLLPRPCAPHCVTRLAYASWRAVRLHLDHPPGDRVEQFAARPLDRR